MRAGAVHFNQYSISYSILKVVIAKVPGTTGVFPEKVYYEYFFQKSLAQALCLIDKGK